MPRLRPAAAVVLFVSFVSVACGREHPKPASRTFPLPSHGNVVRLIVTGDAGATRSRLRAGILAVQKSIPIDAIVLTGDNFYQCGISSIDDPQWIKITKHFVPVNVPIFPVLGNHDYGDPTADGVKSALCAKFASNPQAEVQATGHVPEWDFPSRSYVLRNRLADLVMFDSEPVAMGWGVSHFGSQTSAQVRNWLEGELNTPGGRWKIAVAHHTIYSSGVHGRTNGPDQQNMRALLPLLDGEHVDLYICGHDHDMELLGNLEHRDQPLFLVSGAGSGLDEMRPRKAKALAVEPPTVWPSPIAAMYGFVLLEIEPARLAVTFYDQNGTARSARYVVMKRRG